MSDVKIQCPETNQPVSTGVSMDKASFESAEMGENSFTCPACGQTHTWSKSDAWVED